MTEKYGCCHLACLRSVISVAGRHAPPSRHLIVPSTPTAAGGPGRALRDPSRTRLIVVNFSIQAGLSHGYTIGAGRSTLVSSAQEKHDRSTARMGPNIFSAQRSRARSSCMYSVCSREYNCSTQVVHPVLHGCPPTSFV
jgi:hypothetical protein